MEFVGGRRRSVSGATGGCTDRWVVSLVGGVHRWVATLVGGAGLWVRKYRVRM